MDETSFITACADDDIEYISTLLEDQQDKDFVESFTNEDEWTGLHFAVYNGSTELMNLLLQYQNFLEAPTEEGLVPLHLASQEGHEDCVSQLIEQGCDLEIEADNGWRAIHFSCSFGHLGVTKRLISKQADLNAPTRDGSTPLLLATRFRLYAIAKELLEHGADVDLARKDGWTPLHIAAYKNSLEYIQLLLQHKAQLGIQTADGESALHIAMVHENVNAVDTLLEAVADATQPNKNGWNTLHLACYKGLYQLSEKMIDKGAACINSLTEDNMSALHLACQEGHLACVKMLLRKGASIDILGEDRMTPLHVACRFKHPQIIEILRKEGADVNKQTQSGSTALMIATQTGNIDVVEAVINRNEQSADLNLPNRSGWAPLHAASMGAYAKTSNMDDVNFTKLDKKFANISETIIASGANVDPQTNAEQTTPLMVASQTSSIHCADTLLQRKADTSVVDEEGKQALHCASEKGHDRVVKLLLERGNININAKTLDGSTSLILASQAGHASCVDLLLNFNAESEVKDNTGLTALEYIPANQYPQIAELIRKHQKPQPEDGQITPSCDTTPICPKIERMRQVSTIYKYIHTLFAIMLILFTDRDIALYNRVD